LGGIQLYAIIPSHEHRLKANYAVNSNPAIDNLIKIFNEQINGQILTLLAISFQQIKNFQDLL